MKHKWNCFNPLAGIRCFLTLFCLVSATFFLAIGFNPLAGIRCFLTTQQESGETNRRTATFQSPSGDSLFSDPWETYCSIYRRQAFQSPSGDSLFSDPLHQRDVPWFRGSAFQSPSGDSLFSDTMEFESTVRDESFNPLAGIRCFLTSPIRRGLTLEICTFQSPSGDSLFSDHHIGEKHDARPDHVSIP